MTSIDRVDDVRELLAQGDYIADRSLSTALFLALRLERPLLVEGEAGVGKTELAKVLAGRLGRRLIRLQCYEGLDIAGAVCEWNYPRQMIAIRLAENAHRQRERQTREADIYTAEYLIRRPLLQALEHHPEGPPVLLIDELDRTDEPFEAYLLELLSDWQVSIPELGTIRAERPPIVIVTSNRTREIHDALKRRCLYHWVDYPDFDRELAILQRRVPEAAGELHRRVVAFAQRLRELDLFKPPGVAETVDWCRALVQLDAVTLTPELLADTLGALLKYQDDILKLRDGEAGRLLDELSSP
jgi:MoxR-like ATPase